MSRLTSADLQQPAAKIGLNLTEATAVRAVLSLICVAMAYYFLHSGRRNNDPGRLFWAAVFGVATLLVFCI